MIDLKPTQFNNLNKTPSKVFLQNYVPLLEGAPVMFFSPGGVGKSYAAMRCGIEFFIETVGKVALWLTEDSEAENRTRFHALVDHCYPDKADKIFEGVVLLNVAPVKFTRMDGGNAELTNDFWKVRLALLDYDMVVIDPLLQFQGCDENSNTHAAVWMGAVKQWAAEEMKVILILHHATFDKDGRPKARGAGEWTYGARATYSLQQIRDDKGNLNPECQSSLLFDLTKHNGLGRYFSNPKTGELTHIIEVFPPHLIPKDDKPKNSPLYLSIAPHNNLQQPDGFVWQEIQFDQLHTMLTNKNAYSPYNFKHGYRLGKNNLGEPSLLILDIDDGMTLDAAKETFNNVQSLVITTKSHQQAKRDKPPCDRFRVIVAMDSPMTFPLADYADFLTYVSTSIGGVVDASTTDLARFYLSSPEDAIYHYSESTKRWNWEGAYRGMRKHIRAKKIIQKHLNYFVNDDVKATNSKSNKPNAIQGNTKPADTLFQTTQGEVTFGQLRQMLSVDAKIPVKCHAGIDHGGAGPDHYSAFIKKAENGNVFYSCSGGRCAGVGTLWCEDIDPDGETVEEKTA